MLLNATAEKLAQTGVHTVGVVATNPSRARLYFKYRRTRMPVGADPDLVTHRAYGLPNSVRTPEILEAIEGAATRLLRELGQPAPSDSGAYETLGRLDGFTPADSDQAEADRQQAQLCGQFLVDPDGVVRWANIECARDGLAGVGQMPSDEELLAAARALVG